MGAFSGIVKFEGTLSEDQTEEQIRGIIAALQTERPIFIRSQNALFVQRTATPARYGDHSVASNNRALFVARARLDNRQELAAALQLSSSELARTDDTILLSRMLDRWGDAGVARCLGNFAFAQWDVESRRLILGRDCLGKQSLFFHRGKGFVAFATSIRALLATPGLSRELDEIVLANYLALNLQEARRTFYRAIERVPSRTLVTIDPAGIGHRHYWSPNFDLPPPFRREQDYVERARELFDQAVAAATRDTPHVAIAASGGLDSSAIAATVARLGRTERITCYSLVAPAGTQIDVGPSKYLDERQKVEALQRLHPALEIRFLAPEGPHRLEEDDSRHFARACLPVLNPTGGGLFNFLYDAVGAAGHRRLLMGFLGNVGLTWPGRLSLLALFGGLQWRNFVHELFALAQQTGRGPARTLAGELLLPAAPARLRRLIYRLRGRDPDSVARYSALNPDFIAAHDLAAEWRRQEFDPWFGLSARHPARIRAFYLFDHNQFARDGVGSSFERRGFEISDPHADRRLLEFLLAVPEPIYRRNGIARSFARAVLADRLPSEILNESRSGVQDANWYHRLSIRRQGVALEIDRLEGSPTARRLIDLPRLKRLMQQWPDDEHAAQKRMREFNLALPRAVHVGNFIRWVEGGNA